MGEKIVIGITAGNVKKNDFVQGPYVHQDYVRSVLLAGAVPIIFPAAENTADDLLRLCDGLILSGGCDVDPRFYGEDPSPQIQPFDTERDQSELALFRRAASSGVPVLGICRGFQLINVALGGNLIQDLASEMKKTLQHVQRVARMKTSHRIRLLPGSALARLFDNRDSLFVNSLHHQAIKTLAADFKAVAVAGDGVIEAAEHRKTDRIIGIQWHPESMAAGGDALMIRLFRHFVLQCRQAAENSSGSSGSVEGTSQSPIIRAVRKI